MHYHLEDYGKHVEITSFRGISFNVVDSYLKEHRKKTQNIDIQFFDSDLIAEKEHLYFATVNALQAFKQKTNYSKSIAMETLLYASARRQIQKAIDLIGIKPETKNMAVLIIGETIRQVESMLCEFTNCVGNSPDESALEVSKEKEKKIMDAFSITNRELGTVKTKAGRMRAIKDLVIENMALLATQL